MPSFGLQAPAACVGAASGYTCSATVNVSPAFQLPSSGIGYYGCNLNLDCHFEYCFSADPPHALVSGMIGQGNCLWQNSPKTYVTLDSADYGNFTYNVYAEYRLVAGGSYYPSWPATVSITLNETGPTMILNSPSGIPNSAYTTQNGYQWQYVNGAVPQWITFYDASAAGEPVTVTIKGCTSAGCSPNLVANSLTTPPFNFEWAASSPVKTYTYLKLTAADLAGNQTPTTNTAQQISIFDPTGSNSPQGIVCGPVGQTGTPTPVPCLEFADGSVGTDNDITNDPPFGEYGTGPGGILFSGYSDPSIRGDSVVTSSNPQGNNLWMSYSYPVFHEPVNGQSVESEAVEIHLASSATGGTGSSTGGLDWTVWCLAAGDCHTPLFPVVQFTNTAGTQSITSHEVSNMWPVPNQPSSGTTTWYAVHLMYFITPPTNIPNSIMNNGNPSNPACLVINWAQSTTGPGALAWADTQPESCSGTLPGNSVALTFGQLTGTAQLSQGTCASWGQPAIMVTNSFAPPGQPFGSSYYYVYLAAACLDATFANTQGYYVFYTSLPLSSSSSWNIATGPFTIDSVNVLNGYPTDYPYTPGYITEFDWFMRSDTTVGAVFTPQYIGSAGNFEFGCLATNFNPIAGENINPFDVTWTSTNIIANISDSDTQGPGPNGSVEDPPNGPGPGSCTYEPTSNQGVVFVRRLVGVPSGGVGPYNIYDLVDSGIMP